MNGKLVKTYLEKIIADIDTGKTPTRRVPGWVRHLAVPAAVGLSLGAGAFAGCALDEGGRTITRDQVAAGKADGDTAALCLEIGADEDCDLCAELGWYGDDACDDFCDQPDPDCAGGECSTDEDCAAGQECVGASGSCPPGAYCIVAPRPGTCQPIEEEGCATDADCGEAGVCGVAGDGECPPGAYCILPPPSARACEPNPAGCRDGVDNDGDGLVDMDDAQDCGPVVMYGVPMPEQICDDGIDNDHDGDVDCDDSNCGGDPVCAPVMRYMAPMEDCDDGADNDRDGDVDCDDADCQFDAACRPVARYMAPIEVCNDGTDNDSDGDVDCDDADCSTDPACRPTARYMAPFGG